MVVRIVLCIGVKMFSCCRRLIYVIIFLVKVTEWPLIGNNSAYYMCSWYKYLIMNLVFSHLGF